MTRASAVVDRVLELDFMEASRALRMHWRILSDAAGVPDTGVGE